MLNDAMYKLVPMMKFYRNFLSNKKKIILTRQFFILFRGHVNKQKTFNLINIIFKQVACFNKKHFANKKLLSKISYI